MPQHLTNSRSNLLNVHIIQTERKNTKECEKKKQRNEKVFSDLEYKINENTKNNVFSFRILSDAKMRKYEDTAKNRTLFRFMYCEAKQRKYDYQRP